MSANLIFQFEICENISNWNLIFTTESSIFIMEYFTKNVDGETKYDARITESEIRHTNLGCLRLLSTHFFTSTHRPPKISHICIWHRQVGFCKDAIAVLLGLTSLRAGWLWSFYFPSWTRCPPRLFAPYNQPTLSPSLCFDFFFHSFVIGDATWKKNGNKNKANDRFYHTYL